MDKRELADQYISEVQEDHDIPSNSVASLTLALIRVCEDLLICRNEHQRYKAGILKERQEDLARALGIPVESLISYMVGEAMEIRELPRQIHGHESSQDRSGEEQTTASTNPHGHPIAQQEGPVSSTPQGSPPPASLDSMLKCPNCGEWVTFTKSGEDLLVYCTYCDYKETR